MRLERDTVKARYPL